MPLLINHTFEIKKGIYQPPGANASGIYYANELTHLNLAVRPDESAYGGVYGAGGLESRSMYLYFNVSKNADLSGGYATHLATWNGATGRYEFSAKLEVPKGHYFNFYFVYHKRWRTSYRKWIWRAYGGEYRTYYNDHEAIEYNIDTANFEFNLYLS